MTLDDIQTNKTTTPRNQGHGSQIDKTARQRNRLAAASPLTNNIVENQEQMGKQNDITISFLRASRSGNLKKVVEFLESGQITDINTCNANGLNALHLAAKDGYIDIVTELLKRGIKVDNATKKGNTALHIASLAGQKDVIKLLIQFGANVNVQSLNGFTPLYMAAQENHDACVRFLLSKGSNPSLATEDGFTPLAVAMQQGNDNVVCVLLESDIHGKVRLPALHIAAKKNDVNSAAMLLQQEEHPDVVSKSGFTPLHIAAHYGNIDIAELLINKGADVNYTAKHNITPLHVACKWGKINILKLLLKKNARIDVTTRDGLTPLHCAARSGHVEVIETLLAHNASIVSKTKNGLAALHMAAQGEHDLAARMLLDNKAPVDAITIDYLTALHVAAHCGHVRVAKLLLDYEADPNARALNGFTPLHIACKKNRIRIVELLLKHGANINTTTESGLTPLHVASFMGCMNIVIYLLQNDANADAPTIRGETSLHLAARANQTDIIRILLRNGGKVDARARESQTPLHVACRLGNIDIILLLLEHGADINAFAKDNYTALHIATKEGQEEVVQLLIDNGAQFDAMTRKGFTPLHLAAKYGKENIVANLLQKGVAVNCQGRNEVTPLHVAAHYNHPHVVQLLLKNDASPLLCARNGHSALHIAARKNEMEIVQVLLQCGADVNVRSKSGFTPLHIAAQEGNTDVLNLLLGHSADANATAKNGLTALHLAAQDDKIEVAGILLKHAANISACTKTGYSPLHFASHYGQINMVKFLLENNANIEITTNIGYTPLHQAAQQGHIMIINLLLSYQANPNAVTHHGQTALSIANNLGYITAVEILKLITETSIENTLKGAMEQKYKIFAPELMQEVFMSDSEDEADAEHLDYYQYKYMASEDLKNISNHENRNDDAAAADDQDLVDTTDAASNKANISDSDIVPMSTNYGHLKSINVTSRPPVHLGFLVSFMVDARGGSMRGCRHSGVRIVVPPQSCAQPTRITCRYVKHQRVHIPPPLMEGEALISRILELSPVEATFLGPVILEVPHFGSLRGKEREIIILRSDNGESWREHILNDNERNVMEMHNEAFKGQPNPLEYLHTNRIVHIITRDFPHFFAIVSRVRQEVHVIGPDGGIVSAQAVPQVQAIFPPNALTKKIRVGLQAQPVNLNGCYKFLGQSIAVSPVVTVEPRRRKFHKAITLSIPFPKAWTQTMINSPYSCSASTLRLLCSITGGQNRAIWEDVTGSTPLAFVKDSVTFTTTVSARFWLMDCQNVVESSRLATELYTFIAQVPFFAKFVIFAKRMSIYDAKLSIFCMTDDKEGKTLEQQDNFSEVAKSRDVEVLENQKVYLEFNGNLVPVLKPGEQFSMKFQAFRENRLSFMVHIKNPDEPHSRITFRNEPKVGPGEKLSQAICTLNLTLESQNIVEGRKQDGTGRVENSINGISFVDKGLTQRNKINAKYNIKQQQALINRTYSKEVTLTTNRPLKSSSQTYTHQQYVHEDDRDLLSICQLLQNDWLSLAKELGVPEIDMELINAEYEEASHRAMAVLHLWFRQNAANTISLQHALQKIGRADVVEKCISNVKLITDDNVGFYFEKPILAALSKSNTDHNYKTNELQPTEVLKEQTIGDVQTSQSTSEENLRILYVNNNLKNYTPKINNVVSNNGTYTHKAVFCSKETIRRIAEEHTERVLEEARQNIESNDFLARFLQYSDESAGDNQSRSTTITYTWLCEQARDHRGALS
ncbi:ankyrin-3 isoform X2 [Glossina fuscipes]|uniref:Ankyrin-3 isoform X2 n=1 Tax=Glossina fuscipes TaxID=7396 RepID=A0A9C5ZD43_9MUSC|nr:ankyrin-3 isoform X2 [Glossina fuscipes]